MNFLIIQGGRKALGPLGSGGAQPGSALRARPHHPLPGPLRTALRGRAHGRASSGLCGWRRSDCPRLWNRYRPGTRGAELHWAGNPHLSRPGGSLRSSVLPALQRTRASRGPGGSGVRSQPRQEVVREGERVCRGARPQCLGAAWAGGWSLCRQASAPTARAA